jgi:hypothetical protein
MKWRFFRRSSFILQRAADIRRAAWRVVTRWKVPRIDVSIEGLPLLEAQRAQLRLRHLNEVLERRTGAMLAVAVLIIGLADMVRTWNRSLDHMAMLLGLAVCAGLAGRFAGRIFVRIRVLLELARLRWKVRRSLARRETGALPVAPSAISAPAPTIPVAAPVQPLSVQEPVLGGSCSCGTIAFTLSVRPYLMGTCHCVRCRKSGASTFVMVKRHAFRLTSGSDVPVTTRALDGDHPHCRSFCPHCGTTLGDITSSDESFAVAANCFDTALGISNGFHECASGKPDWYGICDEARQFPGPRPT